MPTWAYVLTGLGTLLSGVVGALVLLRKFPLESRKLTVETVDVNVTIAGKLRDVAVRDWERIDAEMEDLRREFGQYKADTETRHAELMTELRGKRAEVKHLEGEVERRDSAIVERDEQISELRDRVSTLEDEVRDLRAHAGPHQPT